MSNFFFFLQLLLLTSLTSLILRELEYHDFMRLRKIIQKIWNHLLSSQIRCSDLQTGKVKSFCWHLGGNFNQLPRTRGWSWWHWGESGAIACTSEHYLGPEQLCIPLRHFACWRRGERGGLRDWLYSSVGSRWRPLEPPCRGKRNALPPFPPRRSPRGHLPWSLQRWREGAWEVGDPQLGAELRCHGLKAHKKALSRAGGRGARCGVHGVPAMPLKHLEMVERKPQHLGQGTRESNSAVIIQVLWLNILGIGK